MTTDILSPIILFALLLAAAYILVPKNKYRNKFIILAMFAVMVRTALVIYLYGTGVDSFGTDSLLYHEEGIKIAKQLADGIPFYSVDYSYSWYTVFVGLIYHLFGINRYIVSYFNIGFSFLSAILLFKITLSHTNRFAFSSVISMVFLGFPNLILWTSDSRKESPIIFICLLIWYSVHRFTKILIETKRVTASNIIRIFFVCFLIWLSTLIRIYMFIPLAIGIIITQLILFKQTRSKLCIVFAFIVLISSVLIMMVTVMPSLDNYHAISFDKNQSDSLAGFFGSKFGTIKAIASTRNILISIFNYILLPYPGDINIADIQGSEIIELIVSLDVIVWYICILLMIPGIISVFKKREGFFIGLLAFIAVYVFINALVVENVADTIYRYRSVIVGASLLFIDPEAIKKLFSRLQSSKTTNFPSSKNN